MTPFKIRRIVVLSHNLKASAEFGFSPGLNLILGKNKTGKSSIVKSILHAFGCSVTLETSWKQMIDTYIVIWEYNDRPYTLMRVPTGYHLYSGVPDGDLSFIGHFTKAATELSDAVAANIFGIRLTWLTKKGTEVPPSLEHLLSFCYIDQDGGWNSIANSFGKLNYVTRWKENLIKYVVGYQDDGYFNTLKQLQKVQQDHTGQALQMKHVQEFIDELRSEIERKHGLERDADRITDYATAQADRHLLSITELQRRLIGLKAELRERRASRYETALQLKHVRSMKDDLSLDHEFAMQATEELACPYCGNIHTNTLKIRSELLRDIDDAERFAVTLKERMSQLDDHVSMVERQVARTRVDLLKAKRQIQQMQAHANAATQFRIEGKFDVLRDSREHVMRLKAQVDQLALERSRLEAEKKALESGKRKKSIEQRLVHIYHQLLNRVGVDLSPGLRGFLPKIEATGSEVPRLIYAYYVALFLYNLDRPNYPLRWLTVDTMNQQGQDPAKLAAMFDLLHLLDGETQTIVASERETGHEHRAHVIWLNEERSLLSASKFPGHDRLYHRLLQSSL